MSLPPFGLRRSTCHSSYRPTHPITGPGGRSPRPFSSIQTSSGDAYPTAPPEDRAALIAAVWLTSACPTSDTTVLRPCSPADGSCPLVCHPEGHGSEDLNRRLTSSRADGRRASAQLGRHATSSPSKGPATGEPSNLPRLLPPRTDRAPSIWMIPLRMRLMRRPGRGNWCPARPGSPHHDWSNDHARKEGRQNQDCLPSRKSDTFPQDGDGAARRPTDRDRRRRTKHCRGDGP